MTWTTRFATATLLLFLFYSDAKATPPWYKSWRWWLGEVAIAGSIGAFADSTVSRTSSCGVCGPSITAVKAKSGIVFGIETTLHALGHHVLSDDDSRAWQVISDVAIPALAATILLPSTVHNYNLSSERLTAHRAAFLAEPEPHHLEPSRILTLSAHSWLGYKMAGTEWLRRAPCPDKIVCRGTELFHFHCAAPPTAIELAVTK